MSITDLESTIRDLDPAPARLAHRGDRAEEDLRRILATPPGTRASRPPVGAASPVRWSRGLIAVGAAALVVATGVVAVDLWRPITASATWTPAGDPVLADAPGVHQCGRWWEVESDRLRPVLQEKRGDTTLVLAADDAGRELLCTATLVDGQEPVGGMTSLTDPAPEELGPGAVRAAFVETTFQEASMQNGWQADGSTAIAGHVGDDVTRLVLDTDAGAVEASLADGRFAAWWPIEDDSDPHPVVSATVTGADGTTRTVTLREDG